MDRRIGITLFRHGLTADNERSAYIGWTNSPLSENGRIGVKEISEQIQSSHIEAIFSSDLIRCTETAEILFPQDEIKKMTGFRELHFGDWERKTYDELKHVQAYRDWIDHPFESGPVGGEQFSQFENRIKHAFEEIKQYMLTHSINNVAVITHGGVIRCLLTILVKSSKSYFDWNTPFGSGYELSWMEQQAFRRGEPCTSLQEVPLTGRHHG